MRVKIECPEGRFIPLGEPKADNEETAGSGQRLMFRIDSKDASITVFTAPQGEVHVGWVIALL